MYSLLYFERCFVRNKHKEGCSLVSGILVISLNEGPMKASFKILSVYVGFS